METYPTSFVHNSVSDVPNDFRFGTETLYTVLRATPKSGEDSSEFAWSYFWWRHMKPANTFRDINDNQFVFILESQNDHKF